MINSIYSSLGRSTVTVIPSLAGDERMYIHLTLIETDVEVSRQTQRLRISKLKVYFLYVCRKPISTLELLIEYKIYFILVL